MENDDLLRDLQGACREEPIDTFEETKIFDLVLAMGKRLLPCDVFFARATDGSTFTRVVLYPGSAQEMILDMNKWEDEWIDMYSGSCTPWTRLLGAAVDFKIIENKKTNMDLTRLTQTLHPLAQHDRYLAAFVFELTDPFIKVIVDKENCINLSHIPVSDEIIGISFVTFEQFEDALKQRQKQNKRPSMLDDSMIVFDKTGKLEELKAKYAADHPRAITPEDYQMIRFTLLWADNKIRYAMAKGDLLSANLGMHTNINDLLKVHYSLHRKWSKNDKHMLADLGSWDPAMCVMLQGYLSEPDIDKKFGLWTRMIAHTLHPIGGFLTALENNCDCPTCSEDLKLLA